jgi:hypothetical protein
LVPVSQAGPNSRGTEEVQREDVMKKVIFTAVLTVLSFGLLGAATSAQQPRPRPQIYCHQECHFETHCHMQGPYQVCVQVEVCHTVCQ